MLNDLKEKFIDIINKLKANKYLKDKRILIGGGLILILVFCVISKIMGERVQYETVPVERKTITQVVEESGTINPVNKFSVGSTVSGLVNAVYVDYNSRVKKGQLLAEIDPRTFQESVNQSAASIRSAQANLRDMQSNADMAAKTYRRYKRLYQRNFVPKSEYDQAESDYISANEKVRSARADIAKAQSQYRNANITLGFTKIISPVDGVVISKDIEQGQPVAASFQAPEHFVIAQDLKTMQIEVNVSEADIGQVKEGQEAEYTLDGYPDTTFKGYVKQVRLASTTVSNVVTYSVIVAVDNKDLKLKPGMTANVSIITARHKNVLCVPNLALKFTPDKNGKKYKQQGLWVMIRHRLKRISIKTGLSDDSYTEIISDKIHEGDMVAIGIKGDKKNKTRANGGGGRRMGPPM